MILQRYILRELLGSFVFSFSTVLAVCLVGTMFQVFRTFPGVGFEVLSRALPLATGSMASWVMLVASCTSSTLVYARLAAENEITAMRTCGIHLWSIASPAVLLGFLLVIASYPLNEHVIPWSRYHRRLVFRESIVHVLRQPPAGQQDFRIGTMTIIYRDYVDGRMIEPTISRYKDGALIKECFAPAGVIVVKEVAEKEGPVQVIQVILTKPRVWQLNDQGKVEEFSAESDLTIEMPTEDLDKLPRQVVDLPREKLCELIFATKEREKRNPLILILHTRYASSITPLLLVLVAMPIGILVNRGSRLAGLGAALPPLLIYFISYFIFQGLGARNRVPPLVAAYAPDLFLGTLAALLVWKGVRR
jgi:lipopolysaccharide export LptBFGC system permease protein LptF